MNKTAAQITWEVLIKLAAVDPSIRENIRRVARRMDVRMPSNRELDRMFPKGWERTSPSWQAQLEKTEWLKNVNVRKAETKARTYGASRPGYQPRGTQQAWDDFF